MTIRDVLSDNFRKLREATPALNSPKDIIKAGAATNGTIGRISKKDTGISIDKLEPIAEAYGLEVWQLLFPSLQASKGRMGKPVVSGLPGWPFEMVDQDGYESLEYQSKIAVQARLRELIKEEFAEQQQRRANANAA